MSYLPISFAVDSAVAAPQCHSGARFLAPTTGRSSLDIVALPGRWASSTSRMRGAFEVLALDPSRSGD